MSLSDSLFAATTSNPTADGSVVGRSRPASPAAADAAAADDESELGRDPSVPLERDCSAPSVSIECRALTAAYLRSFTDARCKDDPLVVTTRDVVKRIVMPETEKLGKLRYVDIREEREKVFDGIVAVGRSSFFVSHSWDSPWEDLVAAIESHRERFMTRGQRRSGRGGSSSEAAAAAPTEEEPYYWVDIFAINQHWGTNDMKEDLPDWEQMGADNEVAQPGHDEGGFRRVIKMSTRGVVMVLEPWDDPKAVGRVWCLFEAFTGLLTGARRLEVCVSPKQQENFREELNAHLAASIEHITALDLRNAKATVATDWDNIASLVLSTRRPAAPSAGGFDAINIALRLELADWLSEETEAVVAQLDGRRQWTAEERAELSCLGRCQVRCPKLGQLLLAIVYFVFAVELVAIRWILGLPADEYGAPIITGESAAQALSVLFGVCIPGIIVAIVAAVLMLKVEKEAKEKHLPSSPLCLCGSATMILAGNWTNTVTLVSMAIIVGKGWFTIYLLDQFPPGEPDDAVVDGIVFGIMKTAMAAMVPFVLSGYVQSTTNDSINDRNKLLTLYHHLGNLASLRADLSAEQQRDSDEGLLRTTMSTVEPNALRQAAVSAFRSAADGRTALYGLAHPSALKSQAAVAVQLRLTGQQAEADELVRKTADAATKIWNSPCRNCMQYTCSRQSSAPWSMYVCKGSTTGIKVGSGDTDAERQYALALLWAAAGDVFRHEAVAALEAAGESSRAFLLEPEITTRPFTTEKRLAVGPLTDWLWANERRACEMLIENVADSERKSRWWQNVCVGEEFIYLFLLLMVFLGLAVFPSSASDESDNGVDISEVATLEHFSVQACGQQLQLFQTFATEQLSNYTECPSGFSRDYLSSCRKWCECEERGKPCNKCCRHNADDSSCSRNLPVPRLPLGGCKDCITSICPQNFSRVYNDNCRTACDCAPERGCRKCCRENADTCSHHDPSHEGVAKVRVVATGSFDSHRKDGDTGTVVQPCAEIQVGFNSGQQP